MEDNKLVYPVGFDLEKGRKEVVKVFDEMQGHIEKITKKINASSGKNIKVGEIKKQLSILKATIDAAAKGYAGLASAQGKAAVASEKVTQQQNRTAISAKNLESATYRAEAAKLRLANTQNKVNAGFKTQSRLMTQLTSQLGMYASIYALQRFATSVRDITAEFELQRVALTAILQDKAAADKIFGQVLVQALESPFRIKDIISYTKQLAAYRVETENLFETTKRLADISAGLGVDMSRLVLAYGQVRAASVLRGQELRQFTEAGIPLVKLLADKFTELRGTMVSTGEVFELISKRAVPFRMIEEIFNDMTDAGGIFYNMQKIQAETLHGVWMNLKDAYDKMYYEMGQKNMGVLKGLGTFLRGMADNWETIATVLQSVIIGYLSYITVTKILTVSTKVLTAEQIKAIATEETLLYVRLRGTMGVKAATAATKLHTIAQSKLTVANGFLAKSFWKLTAAMAANPIAAIVAGIVAIGVAAGIAIIKANSLKTAMDRLGESTNKFVEMNDKVRPAIETYKELSVVALKSEKQMKDMAGAVETLANKYPSATKIMGEYGDEVEITIGKVERLYEAEMKLASITLQSDLEKLEKKKAILEAQKKAIENTMTIRTEQGTVEGWLSVSWARGMQKDLKRVSDKLVEVNAKIKETKEELGLKQDGGVDESLAGLKKYVSELESLQKRSTGVTIKLYDSEEDVSKFSSDLDLLEDIAKKYKEAGTSVEYLSKQINNLNITQKERDTYKSDLDVARAEQELARLALARYNALYLVEDNRGTKGTTPQDVLRDEINMVKDAREAYEAYLKTMTEVRAKQTVESQLKFAGLDFDISDAGAYREYLQNVYDRIKSDPNYAAVRTLIEDMLVKFDIDRVERELNAKLTRIANNIARTQRANDFFEKILGITGDIELSKMLTIKYTGVEAGDIGYQMKEQLQSALREALGDEGLDLSGMGIEQIRAIVETIPEGLSTAGDKSKKFFQDFEKYMQDAETSALELDEKLRKLGMDDASLFGTGVTLDVQKITRDLSNSNKDLAKERKQLESDVLNDARAKDKKWLDEQFNNLDRIFRTRQENEKTLAQDKLSDLAKTYVEERLFQEGLNDVLRDVGDKTYAQLSRARKMLQSIGETNLIEISDSTTRKIEDLGYTISEFVQIDTLQGMFDALGSGVSESDMKLLELLWTMDKLGLSTENVNELIKEILAGKVSNARTEELKKLSSEVSELSSGISGILNDVIGLFGGDAVWVSGIQDAIDGISKLTSAAVELGVEISKALEAAGQGIATTGGGVAAAGGGIAGAIIAIVGAVIQIGGAVAQVVQSIKQSVITDLIDRINDRVEKLKINLQNIANISGIGDGWFTEDSFQKIRNFNKQINTLVYSLKNLANSYHSTTVASNTTREEWLDLYGQGNGMDAAEWYKRYIGEIGVLLGSIPDHLQDIDIGSIFRSLDMEALSRLKEELEGVIFTQKDIDKGYEATRDSVVEQINLLEQAYADMKVTLRTLVGDISGNMLSAVNAMWDEMRQKGIDSFGGIEKAAEKMASEVKKDVAGLIKDMVAQQLWAATMSKYFNDLGDDLAKAIIGGAKPENLLPIFEEFWDNAKTGLLDYSIAWDAFLDAAESRGWNMTSGVDAEQFAPGSLNELNEQLNDLQEQWNALSQAEREAADGLELWNQIEAKKKEIDEAQSYYDYVSALDEALSKYDELIDKSNYLKSIVDSLATGGEKEYAQSLLDQTNAEIWAGLYAEYLPDMVKFNDELKDMQKQIQWAIDNDYPDLAEWIQKAYDTKVLDKWKEGIDEIASGLDADFDKYKYYQDEIKKAAGMLIGAILGGDDTGSADWAARLKYLEDLLAELEGSMEGRMWDEYATDAQKYEAELSDINKDLAWAIENYPELADEIADAFNTRVLEEWQDAWEDTFGDMDLNLDKLSAIEAALAEIGVPEISEEEARRGRDAALLSGDREAYDYYQNQLLIHQKINILLQERADIIDELGNKYKTEEEEYRDEISQYESDIASMRKLLKEAREDGDAEAASRWEKEIADAETAMEEFVNNANFDVLAKEFKKQFSDISDMGTDEVKKMLDAFKQMIEDSDISEEQKKQILEDIDGIYDELDRRTQEAFNNIADAIRSINSLLETVGADQAIVDSFGAIADAIGIVGDLTYAIASGNWWNVFNLAIKLINATISAIKNLLQYFKGDPFAGVEAIGVRITNAEKAVQKAVGTSVKPAQESLLSVYQDAIDELNRSIAKEKSKPNGWLAKLFGLDTDEEAIAKAKEQIADYEDLMEDVREAMKADFLQTDYTSFSDSLADILIRPWDSYAEMMDAVNELTNDTINNIVRHALSLHLQAQIKDALDALYERGIGDESLELFRSDVEKIVKDGQKVAEYYGKFYDDLASSSAAYDTISRITESQANSFLGYYQNYLIIMTDMHNIMKRIWDNMNRQSININLDAHLTALHTIAANTGAIANNTSRNGAMADDIRIIKNSLARSGAY